MAANTGDYIPLELTEGCPCDDGCTFFEKCRSEKMACKLYKMWINNPRPTKVITDIIDDMRGKIRTPTQQIFLNINKEGPLGSRRSKK